MVVRTTLKTAKNSIPSSAPPASPAPKGQRLAAKKIHPPPRLVEQLPSSLPGLKKKDCHDSGWPFLAAGRKRDAWIHWQLFCL